MENMPIAMTRTAPRKATMACFPTVSIISPPIGILIKVLLYVSNMHSYNSSCGIRKADGQIADPESTPHLAGFGNLPDASWRKTNEGTGCEAVHAAENIEARQFVSER